MSELQPALAVTDASDVAARVLDEARLGAVVSSRLLDAPASEEYDRTIRVASELLDVPVALLSIVDDDRQFFRAALGLPEPWAALRETPLSHSYCQYVVANDLPLVVEDSAAHDLVRDNGATHDLGVTAYLGVPVHDEDGQPLGALCVIDSEPRSWTREQLRQMQDLAATVESSIALRNQLERASRLEASRQDTLAILAHDLRAPLAALVSSSQVLLADQGGMPPAMRQHLAGILERQSAHADEMVNRLLLAGGALPVPHRVDHDVAAEVRSTCDALRASAPDARIQVIGESVAAQIDRMMVRQVVTNLVVNALAHGGPGVRVEVEVSRHEDDLVVEVRDDGPGIAKDRLERVFDCFIRDVDSSGHGLGLHIVKRLAEVQGGTVDLISDEGEGTTFIVRLPAVVSPVATGTVAEDLAAQFATAV